MLPLLDLGEEEPDAPAELRSVIFVGRTFTRCVVRRVDETALAEEARRKAQETGEWQVLCRHGGGTTNAYRHKADTEAALAVANPAGLVVVWMTRLPASKVTQSGAANACLLGTRALFDPRYGEHSKDVAWGRIQAAHREHFQPTAYEHLLQAETF